MFSSLKNTAPLTQHICCETHKNLVKYYIYAFVYVAICANYKYKFSHFISLNISISASMPTAMTTIKKALNEL